MKRKIVQLVAQGDRDGRLFAVADDGTAWYMAGWAGQKPWVQLAELPDAPEPVVSRDTKPHFDRNYKAFGKVSVNEQRTGKDRRNPYSQFYGDEDKRNKLHAGRRLGESSGS